MMIFPPQVLSNLKHPAILSTPQIVKRLNAIPGFIFVNPAQQALTAKANDGKTPPAVGVFFRQKGALDFLENLTKRDATLAAGLKLKAVGLGELYLKASKPQEGVSLAFIPDPAEVEQARQLLKKQGKPENFVGVPLFLAEVEGKGLLNLKQNEQTLIPAFLSLADLTQVLERYNKSRPEGSPEARPALMSLEFLIGAWRKTPDPALSQVQLVAPKSALEEAKALTGTS
jgi:Tic22-like family